MPDQIEERIREHLDVVASTVRIDDTKLNETAPAVVPTVPPSNRHAHRLLVAAAIVLVAGLLALAVASGDDDTTVDLVDDATTTTSTSTSTTDTTAPATTSTSAAPTTTEPAVIADPAQRIETQRAELDGSLVVLQRFIATEDSGIPFGGIAFDDDADPVRLSIAVGEDFDRLRQQIMAEVPDPERVDVVRPDPDVDLREVRADVDKHYDDRFWMAGDAKYAVHVGLYAGNEALAEELMTSWGTAVRITVGAFGYPIARTGPAVCETVERSGDPGIEPAIAPHTVQQAARTTVEVTVTNNSEETIVFDRRLRGLATQQDSSTAVSSETAGVAQTADFQGVEVAPGQSVVVTATVSLGACDPSAGSLLEPGRYDLVVPLFFTYQDGTQDPQPGRPASTVGITTLTVVP